MLKPKYVHGLNADEGSKSLLPRLKSNQELNWQVPPIIDPTGDPGDNDSQIRWTWTLG